MEGIELWLRPKYQWWWVGLKLARPTGIPVAEVVLTRLGSWRRDRKPESFPQFPIHHWTLAASLGTKALDSTMSVDW